MVRAAKAMKKPILFALSLGCVYAAACSSTSSNTGAGGTAGTSNGGSSAHAGAAGKSSAGQGGASLVEAAGAAGDSSAAGESGTGGVPSEAGASNAGTAGNPGAGGTAGTSGNGGTGGISALPVSALPGYQVTVWAQGTAAYTGPDSIESDGTNIWVGYQNKTTKDGSNGGAGFVNYSTIVKYSLDGKNVIATYSMPGHCDGLRIDPTTKKVWASSNEDGSPHLVSIDPTVTDRVAAVTEYTLVRAAGTADHGGGYDDMAFINGKMFMTASNPQNAEPVPALEMVTISGATATLTSVLAGDATAIDTTTDAGVALNEVDPDSLSIDDKGRLVLVNQGGNELVFITNPGTNTQSVKRLPVATQLDDTVWITKAAGQLLVVDGKANTIYAVRTTFTVGSVYTETPDDSSIPGLLATLDLTTGNVAPKIIGFKKPTGLLFVPDL